MKLLKSIFSKNARHFLLMSVSFIMATVLFSCNNDDSTLNSVDRPAGTDDASLLAWQMEKMIKTRSGSYDVALVTTATNFNFAILNCQGEYSIDWGDGVIDYNTTSHTYTDGLPAHTIFINSYSNKSVFEIRTFDQNLIYADISRCPDLNYFRATGSRLTNIDLSKNTGLKSLFLGGNNLSSLDLSYVSGLQYLEISENPIKNIDIKKYTGLYFLDISRTQIKSIDLSNNKQLQTIYISGLPITTIDIKSFPFLYHFDCSGCPIDNLDFSQNTRLTHLTCDSTNITNLDLSKAQNLYFLHCSNCNITDIKFSSYLSQLGEIDIRNNPMEQNIREMTSFALSLLDRSKVTPGKLLTQTPYLSTVISLLDGYNWQINP